MSRSTNESAKIEPHPDDWGPRTFEQTGFSAYRLTVPRAYLTFDLARLRRQSHELIGELTVRCKLTGAKTVGDILSAGDFNCSSVQARSTRAKLLTARALTSDIDFEGYLEELCFRTLAAERTGSPAQILSDIDPQHELSGEFDIHGISIPRRHPTIMFGDGGSAKSYLALWSACELAQQGEIVMYADWEANGSDHRIRLDRLFPDHPPAILYTRCERPLTVESDRLRALISEHAVTYMVLDSAAYGCAGAPESAEAALDYFRALRSLGQIGSLIVAHVTKADEGDKRPFGSSFWHNSARATWNIKRSNPDETEGPLDVQCSHRKANDGRLRPPVFFQVDFSSDLTSIRRAHSHRVINDRPEFAKDASLMSRVKAALSSRGMTEDEIVKELDGKPESILRIVRRAVQAGSIHKTSVVGGDDILTLRG